MNITREQLLNPTPEVIAELQAYYRRVQDVAKFICDGMNVGNGYRDPNYISMERRLTESVNPYYDVLAANGALVIEAYYGMLSRLWTPLGEVSIGGSGSGDHEKHYAPIFEKLNIRVWKPGYDSNMGTHGPWYVVGRDVNGVAFADPVEADTFGREYGQIKELWKKVKPAERTA